MGEGLADDVFLSASDNFDIVLGWVASPLPFLDPAGFNCPQQAPSGATPASTPALKQARRSTCTPIKPIGLPSLSHPNGNWWKGKTIDIIGINVMSKKPIHRLRRLRRLRRRNLWNLRNLRTNAYFR
jgi:hypothetical protein